MTTIRLDTVETVFAILAGAAAFAGFLFAVLRYIIRSETAELRTNGGSTLKDAVNRIEATANATNEMAQHTKAALEEHVADSKVLIERGAETEREFREAFRDMARALPIVAASTPPEG